MCMSCGCGKKKGEKGYGKGKAADKKQDAKTEKGKLGGQTPPA